MELPDQLREVFCGECSWDLNRLIDVEETRQDWVKECFPNEYNDYDKIWHYKFGFMNVRNGDCIAFDMSNYPDETPIIYLSHEDGEGHGVKLGKNFEDFIDKWTQIGCIGPEDWQLIPFVRANGIDPNVENSILWREVINLNFSGE